MQIVWHPLSKTWEMHPFSTHVPRQVITALMTQGTRRDALLSAEPRTLDAAGIQLECFSKAPPPTPAKLSPLQKKCDV